MAEKTDAKRNHPPAAVPVQSVERLTQAIERLTHRYSFWYSFRHGIFVGIGSTVGVALVLYGLFWMLSKLDFIPGLEPVIDRIQALMDKRSL